MCLFKLNCWEKVDEHILHENTRPAAADFADERAFVFFFSSGKSGVNGSELTGEVGGLVTNTALDCLESLAT